MMITMIGELHLTLAPMKRKPQIKIQKIPIRPISVSVSAVGSNLELLELLVLGDFLESTEGLILVLVTDVHDVVAVTTADDGSGRWSGAERFKLDESSQKPENFILILKINQ